MQKRLAGILACLSFLSLIVVATAVPAQAKDEILYSSPSTSVGASTHSHPEESSLSSGAEFEYLVHEAQPGVYAVTNVSTGNTTMVNLEGDVLDEDIENFPTDSHHLVSGCGVESYGPGGFFQRPYCDFTHTAQQMALAGGMAAISGAICIASAGIFCVLAGSAAAALGAYVNEHGLCPGDVRIGYSGTFYPRCL